MPCAYSLGLRERMVAAARDESLSRDALAERFRVSEATRYAWWRRARETGGVAPRPHGGGRAAGVDAAGAAVLTALVTERNERTLAELATHDRARTGVSLSVSAVWRACARLALRRR